MDQKVERKGLIGQDAINLWLKGKDAWNAWVQKNPDAYVCFSDIDFSEILEKEQSSDEARISFENFRFPNGGVNFFNTNFGPGDISFVSADFGGGSLCFSYAKFGDGNVDFSQSFIGTHERSIPKPEVNFSHAEFGKGFINFYKTSFGYGLKSFHGVNFGEGDVRFSHASFASGTLHFTDASFGKGLVDFEHSKFESERINFDQLRCESFFRFLPERLNKNSKVSMKGAFFNAELAIRIESSHPLDLRQARLAHPIDLDNVSYQSRFYLNSILFLANEHDDFVKFRRLKQLAKETDNHQKALEFYSLEMRSCYGMSLKGPKLSLFYLYDWCSDYGRSVLRPLMGLWVVWGIWCSLYWSTNTKAEALPSDALLMSLGHVIPLYSGAKEARVDAISALYGTNIPDIVHVLTISQGIFSGVFLFLIALALRNMFRS